MYVPKMCKIGLAVLLAYASLEYVASDTPGNCTYEEVRGIWSFVVGKGGHDNTIDCKTLGEAVSKTTIKLDYPDEAIDEFGNVGFWTMVYNQGFEVVIHGRKYFAFSKYEGTLANSTSFCDQTMVGWTHDVLGHDWACYQGAKVKSQALPKHNPLLNSVKNYGNKLYQHNPDFIAKINSAQKSWTATYYPEYEDMTIEGMIRRAGGRNSAIHHTKTLHAKPVSEEIKQKAAKLPETFDWRNFNGLNYVSPVRNQGNCGSCFAFASMAMNEARLRILTNNSMSLTFSPQDVVDCSPYSQGCNGGFPYLVAGKYGEDFGLVEESCNPYQGKDMGVCGTNPSCKRHYSTNYKYVGGYYGATNEEEMKLALVNGGPLVIGFMVYPDLQHYEGGVYQHTQLLDSFNPFEITNHAVLLVGYGVDRDTGLPFWSIKNSWGPSWGEQGYFRILRGSDECAVESCVVESNPVY